MSEATFGHDSVLEATDAALSEAYACGQLTSFDAGAVATLRHIARQIDAQVGGLTPDGKLDNVSVPTYLKYLGELGLTPGSRARLAKLLEGTGASKPVSPLSKFQALDKRAG